MTSPTPTRYPNGVVDASQNGAYGGYAGIRPFRYHSWVEDFDTYTATEWVVTETDAGSTEAITSADGGVLAITNVSAGATDEASLQWAGGSGAVKTTFQWDSTKDMIIAAGFKVDDAINTALLIGLASVDTTPVASLPTNGIYFYKAGAATSLIASVRKAGASTSQTIGAMADDTYVDVVFRYSATGNDVQQAGTWQAFLANNLIGTLTTASISPTAALAMTIGLLNASAAAHVLSIDYIQVAKQR